MGTETDFMVVYCTAAPEQAESLTRVLVEERLAACVSIASVRSCYLWEDKLNLDCEALLIIKTTRGRFEALKKRILELHSYAVPEIIALPVAEGNQAYLDWVAQSVG